MATRRLDSAPGVQAVATARVSKRRAGESRLSRATGNARDATPGRPKPRVQAEITFTPPARVGPGLPGAAGGATHIISRAWLAHRPSSTFAG